MLIYKQVEIVLKLSFFVEQSALMEFPIFSNQKNMAFLEIENFFANFALIRTSIFSKQNLKSSEKVFFLLRLKILLRDFPLSDFLVFPTAIKKQFLVIKITIFFKEMPR